MGIRITVVEPDGKQTILESPDQIEAFIEVDETDFVVAFVNKARAGVKPSVWEVKVNVLNVREGPGVENRKLGEVFRGSRLERLEERGEWIRHSTGWSAKVGLQRIE